MYWFEDVIRLETEYPELKSSASNIVDVSELEQRWRKSGEELFEDIENAGLCPVNPVGVEPDPDELFDLINYRKCITPCDLLYGKSEVKNAEIEFEIEHFEKVQQADPIRIAAGHNIADVYRQLGHASINITVDTYYHWLPNQNSSQVSKLDDLGKERNHPQPTRNHKEKGIPAIAATP